MTMATMRPQKQPKRTARPSKRETFAGELARVSTVPALAGEPLTLTIDRGCSRRLTAKKTGDVVKDERDPQRRLVCNIGDVLVVSASQLAINEVAAVVVTRVEQLSAWSERYFVRIQAGRIDTRKVWVQSAKGLADSTSKLARHRRGADAARKESK